MKRLLLLFAFLGGSLLAAGQTDTIFNRSERYHYTCWYDTCNEPCNPDSGFTCVLRLNESPNGLPDQTLLLKQEYTPNTIAVKGLATLVARRWEDFPEWGRSMWETYDTNMIDEYLMLYQGTDGMPQRLQKIRFDSVTPKLVQLRQTRIRNESDSVRYCYSYETFFKEPVYVDSVFFVGQTTRNNEQYTNFDEGMASAQIHRPLINVSVAWNPNRLSRRHCSETPIYYAIALGDTIWYMGPPLKCWYGFFFAIVDYYNLDVDTEDSLMGSVSGAGRFSDLTWHTITATPAPGHTFVQWSDGNTDNPRSVYLTSDTLLTAKFAPGSPCQVEVRPNHSHMGSTSGSGSYWAGDTITISATPNAYYGFLKWDDGDTANPRQVVLTQDTAFTAIFASREGIDAPQGPNPVLLPNPTAGKVQILGLDEPALSVEILDMTGRPAASFRHTNSLDLSDLPQGSYLVQILTAHGLHTLKLVKE